MKCLLELCEYVSFFVILYYRMGLYFRAFSAMVNFAMFCCLVRLCHVLLSCGSMVFHVLSCYVMSCYFMSCHVMLCPVMLMNFVFCFQESTCKKMKLKQQLRKGSASLELNRFLNAAVFDLTLPNKE